MIRRYNIDEANLIVTLNRDFLNREITPEQVSEAVEKAKQDFKSGKPNDIHPIFGVMRDSSICLDDLDFNDRNVYREDFVAEIMLRFKRGGNGNPLVRIPAPYPRLFRHARDNDAHCGYFLMARFFDVCPFGESGMVMSDSNFTDSYIRAKQNRLQEVYTTQEHGPIKPNDLVSLYYIQRFICV